MESLRIASGNCGAQHSYVLGRAALRILSVNRNVRQIREGVPSPLTKEQPLWKLSASSFR